MDWALSNVLPEKDFSVESEDEKEATSWRIGGRRNADRGKSKCMEPGDPKGEKGDRCG